MHKNQENIEILMLMIRRMESEENIRAALASALIVAYQMGYSEGESDALDQIDTQDER